MIVTSHEVEEIRYLVENSDSATLANVRISDVSLFAAVELSCCRILWSKRFPAVVKVLDRWAQSFPILKSAIQTFRNGSIPCRFLKFAPQEFEFYPVLSPNWAANDHHLFASRFTASLRQAGFAQKSQALAGAFREMAENIVQHSSISAAQSVRGLLGYYVGNRTMSFVVADIGRGVLASLRDNPQWLHLSDSISAIEAILRDGASRKINMGPGEGFKQLFKSLANLRGFLEFRSGDGLVSMEGTPSGYLETKQHASPSAGFQLGVTCSI
jgi:hypothetical protein